MENRKLVRSKYTCPLSICISSVYATTMKYFDMFTKSLLLCCLSHFLIIISCDNKLQSTDHKLIHLKRLTSESLRLQGVHFDNDIEKIHFDDSAWGEVILNSATVAIMSEIVEYEIKMLKKGGNITNPSSFMIPIDGLLKTVDASLINETHELATGGMGGHQKEENVYSLAYIKDAQKRKVIESTFIQINAAQICHFQWFEGNTSHGLLFTFKEMSNESVYICGKAPLGPATNHTEIEVACFDVETVSRLIMTALGFVTPIWKPNRDKHVRVNWRNVDDKYKYLFHTWNFDFINSDLNDDKSAYKFSYDFTSTMHFYPTQFSKTGKQLSWEPKNSRMFAEPNGTFSIKDLQLIEILCIQHRPFVPEKFACVDQDVQCLYYQEQKKCSDLEIAQQCPAVCDNCTSVLQTSCTDATEFCVEWKQYCDSKTHNDYMKRNCRNTCGCSSADNNAELWTTVGDTTEVCDQPKKATITSSEDECKSFCKKNQQPFCFWDITLHDGNCFGTISCRTVKTVQTSYRKFQLK